MRSRSLKNSRPGENLKLRQSYARAHQADEFSWWLPDQFERRQATETHHIIGGSGGRRDLVSNLLRLSFSSHNWCHSFPADGRIVCLWVKLQKSELDPGEFKLASGMFLPGYLMLAEAKIRHAWVRPLMEELKRKYT